MVSFSIVICSHNPDQKIIQRLLNAVLQFKSDTVLHEVILVDNNSSLVLEQQKYIQSFLAQKKVVKIIREETPGLTAARIAGIEEASYDWIVFFDDDNEPAADYLIAAAKVIEQYPKVGAWGPGKLQVEYCGNKETVFLKKIKWLFQQRDYNDTHIDNNTVEGSKYYPFGTGMVIRKEILKIYIQKIRNRTYTMSDRKEKNLSSAGDLQMLFTCISEGYYAGSSHLLKLNHLINTTKATHAYTCRLVYALNSSQLKAYNEVFPDRVGIIHVPENRDVIRTFISALRTYRLHKKDYSLQMYFSRKLGELNAAYVASGSNIKPILLSCYEKWINI